MNRAVCLLFFFFNDTATTEIYTLSLHDALPISSCRTCSPRQRRASLARAAPFRPCIHSPGKSRTERGGSPDRKSTRLNSSHSQISYAVFCLKKKKNSCNTDS